MEHLQQVWHASRGTLTLPDTWFRPPLWDLLVLQLLRSDSSNLPCLYSTFHLEYPLVLSRFCLSTHPVHLYPVQVSHILYGACDLRGFNGSLRSAITETKSARNHKHVDRDVVIGVRLLYISVSLQILLIHLLILLINLIISNIIH